MKMVNVTVIKEGSEFFQEITLGDKSYGKFKLPQTPEIKEEFRAAMLQAGKDSQEE